MLSTFTDDAKMDGEVDLSEGRALCQRKRQAGRVSQ